MISAKLVKTKIIFAIVANSHYYKLRPNQITESNIIHSRWLCLIIVTLKFIANKLKLQLSERVYEIEPE